LTGSDLFDGETIEETFYNNKNMICQKPTFEIDNLSLDSRNLMIKMI